MIGIKLRDTRTSLGFSLAEFANLVGVDAETIQRWESGEARPSHDQTVFLFDVICILGTERATVGV